MRTRSLTGILSAALLLIAGFAPPVAEAKDKLPRIRRKKEFQYVDAADESEAAKLLVRLVDTYDEPKDCEKLLKILRTKRSYPRMPSRMTLEYACPDGRTREFTYLLPSKYSKRKPTGVLFFLHGAIRQPPPGGGANEAAMFAPAVDRLNLIVIGPSTYEGVEWGSPACRALVHHALDFAKQHFNVDEDRVYIAGDSDGGRGTYAMLETQATFVAAAVPVIGAPGSVTRIVNLTNVPIFAINGETDSLFQIDRVRASVEGLANSGVDIRFEVAEGVGHDPRLFLKYGDEICDFLEAHPREPFPKRVAWQMELGTEDFGGGFPADTFRWIRIDQTGTTDTQGTFEDRRGHHIRPGFPRIEATYDGNTIEVRTKLVKKYTILVSDEMLDLSQPILVTTNGERSFEGRIVPDARVILEEARRYKDRKLLFVNRIQIEVP